METLIAILCIALVMAGLGLGAMMGRPPVRSSCGAADRVAGARCADCPLRRATATTEDSA